LEPADFELLIIDPGKFEKVFRLKDGDDAAEGEDGQLSLT
jgi:hypothetical protein